MTCKEFLETGVVPMDCVFGKCHRGCELGNGEPAKGSRCNRCGSPDVRWRQQGGRWVLFSDKPGVVHVCERPKASDEFK